MQCNRLLVPFIVFVMAFRAAAEEAKKPEQPAEPNVTAGPLAREKYSDDNMGFSVHLPPGYTKLNENETHEIFKGLSQYIGKEVAERAQKRPPVWFKGPPDPKHAELAPPVFAVGLSDLNRNIDPAQLHAYKDQLEEEYKRQGNRYGEIDIRITMVDGITGLQVEHDVFSPINNERSRELLIAVPAKGKTFNLDFNFLPEQSESVHEALKYVVDSFKINEHPTTTMPNQIDWKRVGAYTGGFFLAGLLLSFVLRKLSATGSGEEKAA